MFDELHLSDEELRNMNNGKAIDVLLRRNIATGTTSIFQRKLLEGATPIPQFWYPDEWFAAIAATVSGGKAGTVVSLETALVLYRQHESNTEGAPRPDSQWGNIKHWLRHSRTTDLQKKLTRLQPLEDFASRIDQTSSTHSVHDAYAFLVARLSYPRVRIARILVIIRHVLRGDYRRFDSEHVSLWSDILQRP